MSKLSGSDAWPSAATAREQLDPRPFWYPTANCASRDCVPSAASPILNKRRRLVFDGCQVGISGVVTRIRAYSLVLACVALNATLPPFQSPT
jgi:hypothetical protein